MFSKEDYLVSIANDENLKETIKRTENLNCALRLWATNDLPSDDNTAFIVYLAVKTFILFIQVFVIVFPYLIQTIPFFIIYASIQTKNVLIIFICLLITILGVMSFLGARGFYVRWCCLYHPGNWALFVVLIDFINIILDIICPTIANNISNSKDSEFLYGLYLHILAIIYNLYRQILLYVLFKRAYKMIREKETAIIKGCIMKWAKDEKYL